MHYSVIRTTSHSWKFVAERGFRLGRGMRWGTWIHLEGPKGRHDRLGIPSQDPRNNLENKTKGHCTNLMIAQVCYVETSHQKNMTSEEKKNLRKMGLGKKKVFSSYSWPLHTVHGLKERWHLALHALRRLATVLGGLLEFNSHNISADFDGDRWGHATPSGFLPPCQWHLLTPIPQLLIFFLQCAAPQWSSLKNALKYTHIYIYI